MDHFSIIVVFVMINLGKTGEMYGNGFVIAVIVFGIWTKRMGVGREGASPWTIFDRYRL